jgi:acid phosphatase (class A)
MQQPKGHGLRATRNPVPASQQILAVPATSSRTRFFLGATLILSAAAPAFPSALAQTAAPKTHTAHYIDLNNLRLAPIVPAPPAVGSTITRDELATLHQIEASRTPQQVAAAQADDAEEDIFSFRTVLGDSFRAEQLPLTAALSAHVHNEEGVSSAELKLLFARPRPYQLDKTLHPVCKLTDVPNSYPSGHTLSGYLLAFTLAEMIPEKKAEILARSADYAHNRLVCGVHYPSDLEASQRIAYAVFGYMLANPRFQADLKAARGELRSYLKLTPAAN